MSPNRNILFHHTSTDSWKQHLLRANAHYLYYSDSIDVHPPTHQPLLPCSVQATNNSIKILSTSHHGLLPRSSQSFEWADVIPYGSIDKYPFLCNITHSDSTKDLFNHILNSSAVTVSDGSFFASHSIGSFGWIVTTPDHQEWIKGGSVTPGPSNLQSAFRSEICGQVAIASFFHSFCSYCTTPRLNPSTPISVKVGIACQPTIPRINVRPCYIKASNKHVDAISGISEL